VQGGSRSSLRAAEGGALTGSDDIERTGEDRILARSEGRRDVDRDVGLDPDIVDPPLVRG
jgi:hypothetical protein